MIKVENLTVQVKDQEKRSIIKGINASLVGNNVVIGPNGSGKTTFIKALLGLVNFTGKIYVSDVKGSDEGKYLTTNLIDVYKLLDVKMSEIIDIYSKSLGSDRQQIIKLLDTFRLKYILNRKITRLSTGESKLFGLAMSVGLSGVFTALDEPFENLDMARKQSAISIINGLDREFLLVTHDIQVLKKLKFNSIYLMINGSLVGPIPSENLDELYISKTTCDDEILSFDAMGTRFYVNKGKGEYPLMSFNSMNEIIGPAGGEST
ncbi:MAG: ATP-binding cassette domain-containing protein [Candidatus Thermoplasmatota archaeon]|jgi:ABC-type Mn2+/Zn2+ transport system ATPase subunit|nr:ATP-binding cassette domain-containing protein [Candidatus Thermoplasmatota archaeon]